LILYSVAAADNVVGACVAVTNLKGTTELAPGYTYTYNVQGGVLEGDLQLNMTCWAGIGFSPDQSMQNATVFIIGTFVNSTSLVATYSASSAPLGHAPPVMNKDQSAIKDFGISFSADTTHVHFVTTLTQLVPSNNLIWAFCANDHTTTLQYHGNNHQ